MGKVFRRNKVSDSDGKKRYYDESAGFTGASFEGGTSEVLPVRESVAYGEESGGALDIFKSLLKKKGDEISEDEFFPERKKKKLRTDSVSEIIEEKSETIDMGASHDDVKTMSEELLSDSRMFGKSDSDEMREVKASIRALLASLDRQMPKDDTTFKISVARIDSEYERVINACYEYMDHVKEKGGGKSSGGRHRLELVSSLVKRYARERTAFAPTARSGFSNEEARTGTWADVIKAVRTETVSLGQAGVSTVGGGASMLYKRQTGNGVEFVKMEERLSADKGIDAYVDQFLSDKGGILAFKPFVRVIQDFYQSKMANATEQEKAKYPDFETFMHLLGRDASRSRYRKDTKPGDLISCIADSSPWGDDFIRDVVLSSDGNIKQWMGLCFALSKKDVEYRAATEFGQIERGSVISDRNESTSRLAEGYGISDIIASSHTTLLDQGDGVLTRGNVMEGAQGVSLMDLERESYEKWAAGIKVTISYTPKSLMQMFTLQVSIRSSSRKLPVRTSK